MFFALRPKISRLRRGCNNYNCRTFNYHQNSGWCIIESDSSHVLSKHAFFDQKLLTMFTFVSVYKPTLLPFFFKKLLYYLFSRVLTHNRELHASDWFISQHCFSCAYKNSIVLFSSMVPRPVSLLRLVTGFSRFNL